MKLLSLVLITLLLLGGLPLSVVAQVSRGSGSTHYAAGVPGTCASNVLYVDTTTGNTYIHRAGDPAGTCFQNNASGAGTGDVNGPASSSDSELALYSGIGGKTLKRSSSLSGVVLLTSGVVSVLTSTGTGNVARATSPAFTTPDLGTPSAATLTNATGLPIGSGVSGLGSNVATFLGTPSSANLAAAVTNETGTGSLVFSISPALSTPDLGTPSALTLTNATGLPLAGLSGLGVGVASFLGTPTSANLASAITNETGSGALVFATNPVLVTPDLGTPSAVTLTNGTGLPVSTGISGLGTGVATFLGTPSSSNFAAAVTGETGTGGVVFDTSPTITTPKVVTSINDSNGNEEIKFTATASAVNEVTVTNAATGNAVSILATGGDSNISLVVGGKGTGSTTIGDPAGTTSEFDMLAMTAPSTPSSGHGAAYVDSTSKNWALKDDAGVVKHGVQTISCTNQVVTAISDAGAGTCSSVTTAMFTGLGTGVATFLGTPSSSNLAAAVTGETGSGALVFATTPSLVSPIITNPEITSQALTDAATITWDMDSGSMAIVVLAGNRTVAAPSHIKSAGSYSLTVTQDGTGSRTLTWNSVFKWPGGTAPTLTTTANAKDLITCITIDGTTLVCNALLDVK